MKPHAGKKLVTYDLRTRHARGGVLYRGPYPSKRSSTEIIIEHERAAAAVCEKQTVRARCQHVPADVRRGRIFDACADSGGAVGDAIVVLCDPGLLDLGVG